jgi:small redox-active disulfide protein 2
LFDVLRNTNIKFKTMEIKVLGTGCPRCLALEKAVREAVAQMGVTAEIGKVQDIVDIMNYGVMHTPALAIQGKVVVSGRVPSVAELKEILAKYSEN